ncbi:MAG: helix-turn-helix domain-containing protein, partial [bacterium]|nr:helix-turn-helix domain-containing protein [bacterium]
MKNILKFDGKDFISAKDAAKLVGYVPDYVGQLARGGKLEARMIGRAWFVSRESILNHRDLNASVSGASRIVDFLGGTENEPQFTHSVSSIPARAHANTFESELSYENESVPLAPSIAPKIVSSITGNANRSFVPLLSKASSLVTTELLQKAAALAVSSAFVFGAYAGVQDGAFERVASFAASAANAVSEISLDDARAAVVEFAVRVPLYAASGAQAFAGRAASLADSGAALADIAPSARNFTQKIAKAFFRGVNLLAVDTGRTLLSLFGAPVPGTGLAVTPPPLQQPTNLPSPSQGPRQLVAAAERITTSERVIERVIIGEISRDELNEKLSILNNKLSSEIYKISAETGRNAASITNVYQTVSHTNKIDKLRTVDIFEPTISGGSISGMGSIGATSANFGTLTGTTVNVTGALSVNATSTLSSALIVDTNTLFVDAANNRVGIGTTSPQYTFDVDGTLRATSFFVSGQTVYENFSVNGNTTLGDATTTDIVYFNSKIGSSLVPTADNAIDLGSTSPWTRFRSLFLGTSLGLAGTATSTGTQLTASGAYLINSENTLSINTTNNATTTFGTGRVGIGTTTPGTAFAVQSVGNFSTGSSTLYGHLNVLSINATSTTATSTFSGGVSTAGLSTSNGLTITASSGAILSLATATSTFSGGISATDLRIGTGGLTIAGGILRTTANAATSTVFDTPWFVENSTATSTTLGGIQANSLLAQNGLTIGGGNLLYSNANFVVHRSGNVGIGTLSPARTFVVVGTGDVEDILINNTGGQGGSLNFQQGGNLRGTIGVSGKIKGNSSADFGVSSNANLGFYTGADSTERLFINSSGNIGIGTVDPKFLLHVNTNIGAGGDLSLSGNDINLGTGTATSTVSGGFGIGIGTTTPGAAFAVATGTTALNTAFLLSNLGSGYTAWFEDSANDASPMVIDAAGNLGIGTSTPGSLFSVAAPSLGSLAN